MGWHGNTKDNDEGEMRHFWRLILVRVFKRPSNGVLMWYDCIGLGLGAFWVRDNRYGEPQK